jgi:2-polyprenyl-6-methoxyphenol hydroxylase-like FAD-dependent oxidoreductase
MESVLVVGAGPTGMTMAIELRRMGFEVRIVERSNHMALHSQALVVQARTLEQLQRYGIATKAVERGRKLGKAKFTSEGKELFRIRLDQIPGRYPYVLFLPQSETEAILNEKMESLGVKTERETELVSFSQDGGGVTAVLRDGAGKEETVRARWMVGCDGAKSTVRTQAGIKFAGEGVGLSFFLGDVEIEGPDVPDDELSIHLHKGDVVFMGRLTDTLTRVIVALHSKQGGGEEQELSIEDFQEAIDETGVQVKVKSAEWMTPFRVNDLQAAQYRAGGIFLAGDASHIHSPVGGQGMNTGMQDAANLAWKLAAVARGGDARLLDSYYEERGAVGKALLRFTGGGLKMATSANPVVEKVRDALLPLLVGLHPVQKQVAGFISETAIEYRSSSIVMEKGGDGELRAGDRMPDFTVGASSLLKNWTDGRHLAVMFDASDAEMDEVRSGLVGARVVSVRSEELDEAGRKWMGAKKKLMIVRPDGYVGYRGGLARGDGWTAYATQDGLGAG